MTTEKRDEIKRRYSTEEKLSSKMMDTEDDEVSKPNDGYTESFTHRVMRDIWRDAQCSLRGSTSRLTDQVTNHILLGQLILRRSLSDVLEETIGKVFTD